MNCPPYRERMNLLIVFCCHSKCGETLSLSWTQTPYRSSETDTDKPPQHNILKTDGGNPSCMKLQRANLLIVWLFSTLNRSVWSDVFQMIAGESNEGLLNRRSSASVLEATESVWTDAERRSCKSSLQTHASVSSTHTAAGKDRETQHGAGSLMSSRRNISHIKLPKENVKNQILFLWPVQFHWEPETDSAHIWCCKWHNHSEI